MTEDIGMYDLLQCDMMISHVFLACRWHVTL